MGYIYLYTGMGGGKTTNALGLALRSVGHGHKVVIIQFMKWWKNIGEYKIRKKLRPHYEIYQFGRKGWIGFSTLGEVDRQLAKQGLQFAEEILRNKRPHLLILDEILLAVHCKLLPVSDVLELLNRLPKKTDVVLTGRYAPTELLDRADFVNEVKDVKHPQEIPTRRGIQY